MERSVYLVATGSDHRVEHTATNFFLGLSVRDTRCFFKVLDKRPFHHDYDFVCCIFRGVDNGGKTFSLKPWLKSEETELDFLRKVSEALLIVVLPKYYAKCPPIRHLLREVVANRGTYVKCKNFVL